MLTIKLTNNRQKPQIDKISYILYFSVNMFTALLCLPHS